MSRTADERREVLRRFVASRNLRIAPWAKRAGVSANSIYNFLNGHSESLDLLTYGKLARAAGVPVWKLNGDEPEAPSPTSVWVVGHVEAGAFRPAIEWDQSDWYSVDVPIPSRFRGKAKALEARGTSMNIDYPPGSVVLWVDMLAFRAVQNDDDVIVYSYRTDGEVEATIKRYRIIDGRAWLWPVSTDPLHQTPIDLQHPDDDIDRVEIQGIVIGSYRARIF